MKRLDSFENTNAYGDFETLKAGGYKCLIKKVECNTSSNGKEFLKISFDIAEGEHKDFYSKKYLNDQRPDKKWSGIWTVFTEGYEAGSTNPKFKGLITSVEESNSGYKFDWNEQTLVNKKVGLVFREEEFIGQLDGQIHSAVKPFYAISYEKAEEAKIPNKKEISDEQFDQVFDSNMAAAANNDDLPF